MCWLGWELDSRLRVGILCRVGNSRELFAWLLCAEGGRKGHQSHQCGRTLHIRPASQDPTAWVSLLCGTTGEGQP